MKRNQDGDLFRVGLYMDPKRDDAIFTGHRSLFKARNRAFAMSAHNGVSAVWNDRDEVVVLFVDQLPFVVERERKNTEVSEQDAR